MNTKEHINSLKELITCKGCTLEINQETVDTIKEVIELLRRGEKHEKIVEGMKRFTNVMTMDIANDKIFELEQKYFPSLIKKTALDKFSDELEKIFLNGIVKTIDENRETIEKILDIIIKREETD